MKDCNLFSIVQLGKSRFAAWRVNKKQMKYEARNIKENVEPEMKNKQLKRKIRIHKFQIV